jgi:hypothetical protein
MSDTAVVSVPVALTTEDLEMTCARNAFAALVLLGGLALPQEIHARDMSGIHAFFNDDKRQFVDLWLNGSGVTVKVSNGRQWRPMWVVLHATFKSGDQVLGTRAYHVYCESPDPGGHGKERWFTYANPGFAGVTGVSISTQPTRKILGASLKAAGRCISRPPRPTSKASAHRASYHFNGVIG